MPKADYFKLFSSDNGVMVALFTSDCGWIENIPSKIVFSGTAPADVVHEEMLLISEFPITAFNPEFIDEWTNLETRKPSRPVQDPAVIGALIEDISREMKLPSGKMRAYTVELFKRMRAELQAGRSLNSNFVNVRNPDPGAKAWTIHFPAEMR